MTTQLTLSGTPEELLEVLNFINSLNVMDGTADSPVSFSEVKKLNSPKKKPHKTEPETIVYEDATTCEVTIEDIRSAVQAKSKAGKREEIKKLLKEFSAASVTELDEENYGEFKLKLDKI